MNNNNGMYDRVKAVIKKIDPSSWPAFFMFAIVLFAAGGLNYVGLSPITGNLLAIAIAAFFGVGVLSWHIVESRTDDSKYQEDVAQIVKWTNVILDGLLIIINLFRAELRAQTVFDGMTTWDTLAFVFIGISAGSHVIGYLLWTQNDPRRMNKKELERSLSGVNQAAARAGIAITKTEQHMAKLKWLNEEEIRLRAEYNGVPGINVDKMIGSMRAKALREFDGLSDGDVQNAQTTTPRSAQQQPAHNNGNRPMNVNAADTDFTNRPPSEKS